jgi:hypothetical protein
MLKQKEQGTIAVRQLAFPALMLAMMVGLAAYAAWNALSAMQFEADEYEQYIQTRNSAYLERLYKHEESIRKYAIYVSEVKGPNEGVRITLREKELAEQYLDDMTQVISSVRRELEGTLTFAEFRSKLQQHLGSNEVRTGAICQDGSISYLTDSRACSSKGGVTKWTTKRTIPHPSESFRLTSKEPSGSELMVVRRENQEYVEAHIRQSNRDLARISKVLRDIEEKSKRTSFTIGSTRDEVFKAMGTPIATYSILNQEVFAYGRSTVTMEDGIVKEYNNVEGNLRVSGVNAGR